MNEPPILRSQEQRKNLRLLLFRALNKNQILILSQIQNNTTQTITSILKRMEKEFAIPLSTLKLNAKILKDLNLVDFGNSSAARLTEVGRFVIDVLDHCISFHRWVKRMKRNRR